MSAIERVSVLLCFLVAVFAPLKSDGKNQRVTVVGDVAFAINMHKQKHGVYPGSWEGLVEGGAIHTETIELAERLLNIEKRYLFLPLGIKIEFRGEVFNLILIATDGDFEGATDSRKGRYAVLEDSEGIRTIKLSEIAWDRILKNNGLNLMGYTRRGEGGNLPENFAKSSKNPNRDLKNDFSGGRFPKEINEIDADDGYSDGEKGVPSLRAMLIFVFIAAVMVSVIGWMIIKKRNSA